MADWLNNLLWFGCGGIFGMIVLAVVCCAVIGGKDRVKDEQ